MSFFTPEQQKCTDKYFGVKTTMVTSTLKTQLGIGYVKDLD